MFSDLTLLYTQQILQRHSIILLWMSGASVIACSFYFCFCLYLMVSFFGFFYFLMIIFSEYISSVLIKTLTIWSYYLHAYYRNSKQLKKVSLEKLTRKTCFFREKIAWLHASTLQTFARQQFFKVNKISIIFSQILKPESI